jgi:hypothetical protein
LSVSLCICIYGWRRWSWIRQALLLSVLIAMAAMFCVSFVTIDLWTIVT